jgi:hypothetical protein
MKLLMFNAKVTDSGWKGWQGVKFHGINSIIDDVW